MEQITVNSILIGIITLFIPLVVYVFIDFKKSVNKKIDENKGTCDKEIEELKRKLELTEAHLREFENVKFTEIMTALNGLITDVAVIKSEMLNLQNQNKKQ